MVGIYKITSPSNKIYIGQSNNIKSRFQKYKYLSCKAQTILYRSLLKYGWENHKFEIVTLCYEEQLNEFERDFQEAYDVIGPNGLNCRLTTTDNKSGKLSDQTKIKIGLANKGKIHTQEFKDRISLRMSGENHCNYGKPRSDETKEKLRNKHLGKIITDEAKVKMRNAKLGGKLSKEHKLKLSLNNANSRKVINIDTSEIYTTILEAADKNNMKRSTLTHKLLGSRKNNTNLRYYEE